MFCKTIILSNSNNINTNSPKGILTLSRQDNKILGKIRLYNISTLPTNSKIGLYINETVYTSNIIKKPHHFEFILDENIDITQSIYCAIIDNSSGSKTVVLEGGSFNGFCFADSPIDAVLEAKDEQLDKEIDEALSIDECNNCKDCTNCEYKKFFYQNQTNYNDTSMQSTENVTSNIEMYTNIEEEKSTKSSKNEEDVSEQLTFLNEIIYQLDEMFAKYPSEDILNSIIPDSKFIKVDGEKPYVLGAMYENKLLKYIAYGVPATYNSLPPADLGQHYQWLPLNPNDMMSDGYYMIYQDATNGTIVEINFE